MIRVDVISGSIITAASVALLAYSNTFSDKPSGSYDIGTKFFPQLLLITAIVIGSLVIIQGILKKDAAGPAKGSGEKPQTINALIGVALTVLYLVCIYFGGYFWATPVFIAAVLWVCGIKKIMMIIYTSLGFLAFSFIVFYYLLNVPFLSI